ncbi:MAG: hypothetical protein EOO16_01310 [Chitinophagaceae bacterium]|nr:MAG: hypothetical protein EOO16_01310 [Chitinophagaceae bacterium]
MRPSDKVWKGIEENLKRRRRRMGWFTSLFLLCTSAGAWLLTHPGTPESGITATGTTATASGKARNSAEPGTTFSNSGRGATGSGRVAGSPLHTRTGATATNISLPANEFSDAAPVRPAQTSGTAGNALATNSSKAGRPRNSAPGRNINRTTATTRSEAQNGDRALASANTPAEPLSSNTDLEMAADEQLLSEAALEAPVPAAPALATVAPAESAPKPELQKTLAGARRMSLQFFFTPTVSYRSLSENKDYAAAAASTSTLYNINDVVTHKPNIGVELGLSAKVPVSRMVKLQGGFQFNVSRYDVQAFDNAQPQPALMAFIGGGGQTSQTNYTNLEGSSAQKDWLQNMYFQVSAPVGIEVMLAGNTNTQFGIASTIQPTFILSDQSYMLSTDYKSYAEVPWLIRRWNLNTALSTYVGYSTGKLNWQIGPQVRYQLFSSFVNKYPVKENLFDFGLRVGVSLNSRR